MSWSGATGGGQPGAGAGETPDPARARAREMGARLRRTRIERALSLSDAQRDTKINRIYLEAFEEGQVEALPAPVYARGFMRSYARYLGIDPDEAVATIPDDLLRPAGLEPLPGLQPGPERGSERPRAGASLATAMRERLPGSLPASIPLPLPAWVPPAAREPRALAIAAGVVLVLLVFAVFALTRGGGESEPGDGGESAAVAPTPTAPATPAFTPTPQSTPEATRTASPTPGTADAEPDAEPDAPAVAIPDVEPGTVPPLVGMEAAEAEQVLASADLGIIVFETPGDAPPGHVFEQSPAAGDPIDPGRSVTLFVSP